VHRTAVAAGRKPAELDGEETDEHEREQEGGRRLSEHREEFRRLIDPGILLHRRCDTERDADEHAESEREAGQQERRAGAVPDELHGRAAEAVRLSHVAARKIRQKAPVLDDDRIGEPELLAEHLPVGLGRLRRQHQVRRVATTWTATKMIMVTISTVISDCPIRWMT
jgi:hypothetical protein